MLKWHKLDDRLSHDGKNWQPLGSSSSRGTYRAQIPGGWLVRFGYSDGSGDTHSFIFIPDPSHSWTGDSSD